MLFASVCGGVVVVESEVGGRGGETLCVCVCVCVCVCAGASITLFMMVCKT